MKITCIIIEDEPLARERLVEYINRTTTLNLLAQFDDALTAFAFLKNNGVDLIFLDINLGRISGIEMLETTRLKSRIIITTAYHEFALKGYELSVTDYLLKPYTFERFTQAVAKIEIAQKNDRPETSYIFIKTENRLEKIDYAEILFIEGMRDYRRIHTATKKIMTLQNFSDLEREIPRHIICRVHKSYMVSISKIDSIERDEIKIGNTYIPISDTYRKEFLELLGR